VLKYLPASVPAVTDGNTEEPPAANNSHLPAESSDGKLPPAAKSSRAIYVLVPYCTISLIRYEPELSYPPDLYLTPSVRTAQLDASVVKSTAEVCVVPFLIYDLLPTVTISPL
jgi:hypothetical protein